MASCTSTPPKADDAPAILAIEAAATAPQPVGSHVPSEQTADLCKAGDLQWLVGKRRTEIPVPVDVVNRRVTCTACPITEDYSPYRLNIFYDRESGVVEQVRCG